MKDINTIVMDVDGTLTDGTINIGQEGELFKSFYCRDGLAIIHAIEAGMEVVILTSRSSRIVKKRAEELGISVILQGAKGKKESYLSEYMAEKQLKKENVAYIGDDVNDLGAMTLCGLIGCPGDSVPEVKAIADYICKNPGGRGAVREYIDWLIAERRRCRDGCTDPV